MQLFNEEFTTPGDLSLYIFSSITFKIGDNISEYKKKKKKIERVGRFHSKLVFERLIAGLPMNLE